MMKFLFIKNFYIITDFIGGRRIITNIIIYFISVISIWKLLRTIGIHFEKKKFNNGFCKKCGSKLQHFDCDSQGGRGYCCDKCNNHIWISYSSTDKDYWKNEKKE